MSLLAAVNEASVGNFYFQLVNDPSANNAYWSTYPAISDVDCSGFRILNCRELEIDGQFLTADTNDLLLNGVPIATIDNVSNVAEWSQYASLSGGVDMATYAIRNLSAMTFVGGNTMRALGNKILLNGADVLNKWSQCNALTDVNVGGHNMTNVGTGLGTIATGTDDILLVNGVNVATKWSDHPAQSNIDMASNAILNAAEIQCSILSLDAQNITATASDLYVNGMPVGSEWSLLPAIHDVSMAQHSLQDVSSIDFYYGAGASVLLNASGGQLYANGIPLATGESANRWSVYPAITNVNMGGNQLNNATRLAASNLLFNQEALRVEGNINMGGDFQLYSTKSMYAVALSYISNVMLITDYTSNYSNAASNIYLGKTTTAVAYPSSTIIRGACTIDGGNIHGCTIGCLPFNTGINSVRIDVLPVGINVTSPTFITMNCVGAANIAAGGAVAFAAGSYMTLEHGFGFGSNGIYVQSVNRADDARVVFEFGGSIGNSVDTPTRAGRMEFFGTSVRTPDIGPNTDRYPRLPYMNIRDVSSMTFFSGLSGGGASMIAGPSGQLTISGNIIIPTLNFSGVVTNPMTSDLNGGGYDVSGIFRLTATQVIGRSGSFPLGLGTEALSTHLISAYLTGFGIRFNDFAQFEYGLYTDSMAPLNNSNINISGGGLTFGICANSIINQGISAGYALSLGGSVQIAGNLNLQNNSLINVGSAYLSNVHMLTNLDMSGHSIDRAFAGYFNALDATNYLTLGGLPKLSYSGTGTGLRIDADTTTFYGDIYAETLNASIEIATPCNGSNIANKAYVDAVTAVPANRTANDTTIILGFNFSNIVGTTTIVLTQPSKIFAIGDVVLKEIGGIPTLTYVGIGYDYNLPTQFSMPVVPSMSTTPISCTALTPLLAVGSHLIQLYAHNHSTNITSNITCSPTNITGLAGYI